MFDNKMICTDGFENEVKNGQVVGFSFLARLPYYRGLGLSMVEEIEVTVDGEKIPRGDIRFSVRGRTWTLDQMENEYGDRWNFGEKARVTALKAGGLKPGKHRIELLERLRISYLPFTPSTRDVKEIELSA
jgi:hypothetical protein